jgi:predicted amidohydrolase YtcJ
MEKFLENGLTTIHDAIGDPEMIRVFQTLDHEDGLRLRVHMSPDIARFGDDYLNTGIHTAFGSEKLKFHQMKIILNTFSGATAALFEDYANDPEIVGIFSPLNRLKMGNGFCEEWVVCSYACDG